jgi:hypothetical protein
MPLPQQRPHRRISGLSWGIVLATNGRTEPKVRPPVIRIVPVGETTAGE